MVEETLVNGTGRDKTLVPDGARTRSFQVQYMVGLDLGQKQDYSAIALIERVHRVYDAIHPVSCEWIKTTECRMVHVARLPLGLAYPDVVGRVRAILNAVPPGELQGLVVDATGVGAPVVDLFRAARLPGRIVPVTITGGDNVTEERGAFRVPKRDIITGLQVAFETKELQLEKDMPGVEPLIAELMSLRATVTSHGHERVEPWRSGAHDDLVLAAGLAWWWMVWDGAAGNRAPIGPQPHRLFW